IVALIDSGVDTSQEDLQGRIWTNPKEIPGNGLDDDHDGYIDDIHGWNFLGGKNGKSVTKESGEAEREFFRLRQKYGEVKNPSHVKDKKEYAEWLGLKKKRKMDSINNSDTYLTVHLALTRLDLMDSVLKKASGKDTLYKSDIEGIESTDSLVRMAKDMTLRVMEQVPDDYSLDQLISEGKDYLSGIKEKLAILNMDPNATRRKIVGDNPFDIKDVNYGNNNVSGSEDFHGTHVAGIIAADRNNGIGMNGITDDVKLMILRAVPDGDERDKDIALAIRYAVNHGAEIINMSFGKGYSPGKKWVDDAVKYAERKDVLLVHAAGNEGSDDDSVTVYPSPVFLNSHDTAENFITVGASSSGLEGDLVPSFSNYGKKIVDLFAPGVDIYSTIPGNKYERESGTSMATPVVTGIAALLLEFYPKLSAVQLKYVLDHSVMKLPGKMVTKPGTQELVPFSSLSKSGGIVNAYNALKLASTIKGKRRIHTF
ncbi:MAG: S8 family serine peptidase, partial [Chitinophagaceae bacterium]